MYISRFQLDDYKSIYESDEIELTPGVNLIVGKNNAGKTALLESLGLRFSQNLYRSSKVRRKINPADRPMSSAEISITITRNELWSILGDTPGRFGVPLPKEEAYLSNDAIPKVEQVARFLNRIFEREEFTLRARYKWDTNGSQFLPSQTPCFGAYEVTGMQIIYNLYFVKLMRRTCL